MESSIFESVEFIGEANSAPDIKKLTKKEKYIVARHIDKMAEDVPYLYMLRRTIDTETLSGKAAIEYLNKKRTKFIDNDPTKERGLRVLVLRTDRGKKDIAYYTYCPNNVYACGAEVLMSTQKHISDWLYAYMEYELGIYLLMPKEYLKDGE